MQTRKMVRAWIAGAAVLALALLLAAFLFFSGGSRPGFEEGDLLVCVNGGGTAELFWPSADAPAAYYLETRWDGGQEERYYSRPSAQLSGLPEGEKLQIRIQAVSGGAAERPLASWKTLKAGLVLPGELPSPPEASASVEEGGVVSLRWSGGQGELYEVFAIGENGCSHVASTREQSLSLQVGGEDGLAVPGSLDSLQFFVRSGVRQKGFILCGPASEPVTVSRQDLPSGPLSLTCRETAPRMYVLEWDGTRCDRFEVREWWEDGWQTLARLAPAERMHYDAGRLRSGSRCRFQVAALNRDGSEVESEEVSFYASISPLYSTVWPIQDLTLRENPGAGDRLAAVPGGTALCVLAEEGNWFRVRYQEEYGWLDSRYCMINLPEYIGDHCAYDITNSYRSLFAAHDAPIRKITNQVIEGFENIRTAEGEFLVPYLYPCSKKLLAAAQAAEADGYRLKIYEAFRPQRATRFLYDTASAQQNQTALAMDGGGRAYDPQTGREVELSSGQETRNTVAQPSSRTTTLSRLMTDNGRFSLGSFLAKVISAHNRGIALDLTLERTDGGGELEMQSRIHDLSWYAATDRNNLNARLLANYMKDVGMSGLSSEWWHFQDDGTREAIKLNASLYEGVSPEGWVQDDTGWRYRNAGGSYVRNTTLDVDGRSYTFDAAGYAVG